MRIALIILVITAAVGCRDVIPVDNGSLSSVPGFQIEGSVVDSTDRGIFAVSVRLAYTYVFYDSVPPGPLTVVVPKAGDVQIQVFDMYSNLLRRLYDGYRGPGVMNQPWDRRDSLGTAVGSGVYYYNYFLDGDLQLSYPILIDSAATAYTDNAGNFTIPDVNFPIGTIVPRFARDGSFLGNFIIYDRVNLLFTIDTRSAVQQVALTSGRASTVKQVL